MVTVLIAIFRYLIVLIMLAYTFECFSVFRYHNEESRKHIYLRQNIWMFLLQICAYLALLMVEENKAILLFYFLQLLIMIAILALYHALYPHANRLILNNMCMLLSIGFIILTRLSHEKVLRQFSIATLTLILSLLIPYLFKTIREYGRLRYVFSLIGIFALSVVLVFSRVINGSKLNVSLFGITFQPSEFVKLTFVFAIAGLLYQSVTLKEIVISAAVAGLHVIILVLSKDLGSAVLYFAVYFAMLYIATGKKLFYLAGFAGSFQTNTGYYSFAHPFYHISASFPNTRHILHGEKVGYGILAQLLLEKKNESEIVDTIRNFSKYDNAFTLSDIGLNKENKNELKDLAKQIKDAFDHVVWSIEEIVEALVVTDLLVAKVKGDI